MATSPVRREIYEAVFDKLALNTAQNASDIHDVMPGVSIGQVRNSLVQLVEEGRAVRVGKSYRRARGQ